MAGGYISLVVRGNRDVPASGMKISWWLWFQGCGDGTEGPALGGPGCGSVRPRRSVAARRDAVGEQRSGRIGSGVSCRHPLSRGPRAGAMVWSELVCGPFETVGPVVGAVSTPTPERRAWASLCQE